MILSKVFLYTRKKKYVFIIAFFAISLGRVKAQSYEFSAEWLVDSKGYDNMLVKKGLLKDKRMFFNARKEINKIISTSDSVKISLQLTPYIHFKGMKKEFVHFIGKSQIKDMRHFALISDSKNYILNIYVYYDKMGHEEAFSALISSQNMQDNIYPYLWTIKISYLKEPVARWSIIKKEDFFIIN